MSKVCITTESSPSTSRAGGFGASVKLEDLAFLFFNLSVRSFRLLLLSLVSPDRPSSTSGDPIRGEALGEVFVDMDLPFPRGVVRERLKVFQSVFFKFMMSSMMALISPRPGSVFDLGLMDRPPDPAKGGSLGLATFGEKELDLGMELWDKFSSPSTADSGPRCSIATIRTDDKKKVMKCPA